MTSYIAAPGPSRASRITLPPMMMMAPSNHHRTLDYNHDLSQAPYLRHPYVGSVEHGYNYEFAGAINYHPTDAFPSHPAEMDSGHNTDASPSLSLSLLLAAANAAQADTPSYAHSPIHFPPTLSLGCRMDPSGTYSPAVTSPEPPAGWPTAGLAASDSDRLVTTPPQTPLSTPELLYEPSMMACCSSRSDEPYPHNSKWPMDRIGLEPTYIHRTCLPALSCMDYNPALTIHRTSELISNDVSDHQKLSTALDNSQNVENSQNNTQATFKRIGKKRKLPLQTDKQESCVKEEPALDSEEYSKTEKPKQGRKKRSVGYVRPIIIHRKRVGQRLLDMLRAAPIPSKAPAMELNRARCFPFADMKNKLKLWYGLQIEWPSDAPFGVDELRSTRRMRLDELERLDKTLDGGGVRLRLSEEVLAEEPHRAIEFSLPSDGNSGEENVSEHSEDQDELDETNYRRRKRKR